jgi:hypothetical protein
MTVHRDAATTTVPRNKWAKPKPPRRAAPVQVTRVDPRVLSAAMKLAGGDVRRLRVISPTRVEVTP